MLGTWSRTATMSSRVMLSGVLTLSGPETLPPTYIISLMFGPMLEIRLMAYWRPVRPSVATRIIDAEPMTMPSIVSRNRVLLARKLSNARLMVSRKATVERALRRMLSKERPEGRRSARVVGRRGLGMLVGVAIVTILQMLSSIAATRVDRQYECRNK